MKTIELAAENPFAREKLLNLIKSKLVDVDKRKNEFKLPMSVMASNIMAGGTTGIDFNGLQGIIKIEIAKILRESFTWTDAVRDISDDCTRIVSKRVGITTGDMRDEHHACYRFRRDS